MSNKSVVKKIVSIVSIIILLLQSFNINFDARIINEILIAISSLLAILGIISTPNITRQLNDIFGIDFKEFNLEEFIKKLFKNDKSDTDKSDDQKVNTDKQ